MSMPGKCTKWGERQELGGIGTTLWLTSIFQEDCPSWMPSVKATDPEQICIRDCSGNESGNQNKTCESRKAYPPILDGRVGHFPRFYY